MKSQQDVRCYLPTPEEIEAALVQLRAVHLEGKLAEHDRRAVSRKVMKQQRRKELEKVARNLRQRSFA